MHTDMFPAHVLIKYGAPVGIVATATPVVTTPSSSVPSKATTPSLPGPKA
jgi:hypothetical protein